MAYIASFALARAALLEVGWRGGWYSLFLPARTGTVSFFLLIVFGSCYDFLDCFRNFHALKHITCLFVGPYLKVPSLDVGLFCPRVWDGVKDNLVEFFGFIFLAAFDPGKNVR